MKKLVFLLIINSPLVVFAQKDSLSTRAMQKKARAEKVQQLMKQAEDGALIFQKQNIFGIKLNTDGFSALYEHGKFKNIDKANIWWLELGERKDPKQEKVSGGFAVNGVVNSYIYGKQNNFYFLKGGVGQQRMLGYKGNKNGIAVSALFGAGLSLGMLKPYYLEVPTDNWNTKNIKYSDNPDWFLTQPLVVGAAPFGTGFNEIKFVPGWNGRAALRFDYGRFNDAISALEIGVNAEYYMRAMPIMVDGVFKQFFLQTYVAIEFGNRK